jgi:PAS domain S-box-containing protein
MTTFQGKPLEILGQDGELACYRGFADDGTPFLMLAPLEAHPARTTLARLEHEYALRGELDPAWAVRPRALRHESGRLLLLLDDPGGDLLESRLGTALDLATALALADALATALGQVHACGLIHKDLAPVHVLVRERQVRLLGFGRASRLPCERRVLEPSDIIAGSLPYLAPEQTGRMNRSVDARCDFYALGVILYRMLTGELPFATTDPLEAIHCHIARQPIPPAERRPGLPEPVSAMVMKLLAKMPEERYQSAAGVAADLRHCQEKWASQGNIPPFRLGSQDISEQLRVPEKLYGREVQVRTLVETFEQVVATGNSKLALVSGYAGIGKSAVVNELQREIVAPRGFFTSGKFDQYKRDIPYAPLAEAFQALVHRLLGKSETELRHWREALLEAINPYGQLMIDLVPELELVIGAQPAVPELPPMDAQNRFQSVFRKFLCVFAQASHPLILFLDDLQWLDAATLRLLHGLITDEDVRYLLLVGAYRDNEVGPDHPLMLRLDAIRQAGASVTEIVLAPLSVNDVTAMLTDSLHRKRRDVEPLAALVHAKTAGNPFFAIQFLITLCEEGLLTFGARAAAWTWDIERIHAKGYTDNVVEFLVGKLARLPAVTQDALRQLACLGNAGDVATLAMIRGEPEAASHQALWEAHRAGLVWRRNGTYAFLHDRVQEAAYSLIPEAGRPAAHLHIGRLLLAHTPPEELAEHVFDIVNQLNRGAALMTARAERESLAELNLVAGKRARAATAYASASVFFTTGSGLLAQDCWDRRYALAFALELGRAECESLNGQTASAEERLAMLARRATGLVDAADVACAQTALYAMLDRPDRSVAAVIDYLRRLDIEWSPHPTDDDVRREFETMWQRIGSRAIEELIDLPLMHEAQWRGTLEVLMWGQAPALHTDANLLCLVAARMANISMEHGNSDASCLAYVALGTVLGPHFGDYQAGFRFGKLGFDLLEQRGLQRFKAQTYLGFGFLISPWSRHVTVGIDAVRRAFDAARESGNLVYASYCCNCLITLRLAEGSPLGDVQREAEHLFGFAQKARFGLVIATMNGQLMFMRALRGLPHRFRSAANVECSEEEFQQHLEQDPHVAVSACAYWIRKLQVRFFDGDDAGAIEAAAKAQTLLWTLPSFFELAEYHFYDALARAARHDAAPAAERPALLESLAAHHRQIAIWAASCQENFRNRAALVAAEIARVEHRDMEAMRHYEEAIAAAREQGTVQNEALAYELASNFYRARGFAEIADTYLRQARACYVRYGADGKVNQLDQRHAGPAGNQSPATTAAAIETSNRQLDIATVVKASQAVSREIVLPALIETLMRMTIEHAGADRGLLILPAAGGFQVEAEAISARDKLNVAIERKPADPATLPESLVRYVARVRESILLDDVAAPHLFSEDPYFHRQSPKSVLCIPLIKQTNLVGMLYLENHLAPRAFTRHHLAILELLASQAAISLENATLYASLQAREARIRRLVESSIIGIFFWGTDGSITEANEAFLQMVGYSREELLAGKVGWERMTLPEYKALDEQKLAEVRTTRTCTPYEKEFLRKDGGRVPVLLGAVLFDDSPDHGVAFVLDLSERKRAEAERQARHAAEAASRAKTAFLANMSHELRTPLNGILGYAQILERDPALGERQLAGINIIRKSGEHLLTLINDILDMAKIEAGKVELYPVDIPLVRFVQNVADIVGVKAAQKKLQLVCDLAPDLPSWVRADEKRLRQVLLNLLSNAVKFTDDGEVTLHVRFVPPDRLGFEVRDTGIGIAADQLGAIFEPFEQAGDVRRHLAGTGLGLAISRQYVRMMGGEILVDSQVGQGSTFRFEVKAPPLQAVTAVAASRTVTGYAGPRKKVLVVDDVAENRAVATDLLTSLGFDVAEAANGQEGLERAQRVLPDLLLLDVSMPKLDGLEFARMLRQQDAFRRVPIIALSASVSASDSAQCLAAGMDAFLPKPLDADKLLEQMARLLHLTWTYRTTQPAPEPLPAGGPIVVPPEAEMELLYRLARLGNMQEIMAQVERLTELDERYRPFADRLSALARGYQSKAVLRLVEEYRQGGSSN